MRGLLPLLGLCSLLPFVLGNHINLNSNSCRNICQDCGFRWAFDVTDATKSRNYCYYPPGGGEPRQRCFGPDSAEALGCASLRISPLRPVPRPPSSASRPPMRHHRSASSRTAAWRCSGRTKMT